MKKKLYKNSFLKKKKKKSSFIRNSFERNIFLFFKTVFQKNRFFILSRKQFWKRFFFFNWKQIWKTVVFFKKFYEKIFWKQPFVLWKQLKKKQINILKSLEKTDFFLIKIFGSPPPFFGTHKNLFIYLFILGIKDILKNIFPFLKSLPLEKEMKRIKRKHFLRIGCRGNVYEVFFFMTHY